MKACESLAAEGIEPAVITARFVKPMDVEMIREVAARYPILISVEDGCATGGFGSAVNEALVAQGIPGRCEILGTPDFFIEHGDQASQQDEAGISAAKIADRVREALSRYQHPEQQKASSSASIKVPAKSHA
jgi:1-deoxy-D-xylulose-5-phosphate synthase